jgi:putative transposase
MSRAPRPQIAGLTFHVVQRGNHRERIFFQEDDYHYYLHRLALVAIRYETRIHAYVLMTNHVHLLATAGQPDGVSRTMQDVAGSYSRWINKRLDRKGRLWEGRFHSSLIDSDYYCLACYRYIELNPVRAGLVPTPSEYRWSSYHENAGGPTRGIVDPHACYVALGPSRVARVDNYRSMVAERLPNSILSTIREGMRRGLAIGDERATRDDQGENVPRRRGRPRRPARL